MHLRNGVCACEPLDSSATYFAVSMTEELSVTFCQLNVCRVLNTGGPDQDGHITIHSDLRIAHTITKFGAPLCELVTTNEPQVGWDTPSFYFLNPRHTARDPKTRADKKPALRASPRCFDHTRLGTVSGGILMSFRTYNA